jgi:hypothetical protein
MRSNDETLKIVTSVTLAEALHELADRISSTLSPTPSQTATTCANLNSRSDAITQPIRIQRDGWA